MAGRTMFNFRVLRCPSCSATLPINADDTMVICEYCDARVQVARAKTPASPPAPSPFSGTRGPSGEVQTPRILVAKPHASVFAWLIFSLVLTFGVGGAIVAFVANTFERTGVLDLLGSLRDDLGKTGTTTTTTPSDTPLRTSTRSQKKKKTQGPKAKSPSDTAQAQVADGALKPEVSTPPKGQTKTKVVARPAKPPPPEPTGPVLSVPDAQKALNDKVLACMRENKVHDILAYMGNSKVGAVKVLGDSRSRVDGMQKKVMGTKLGNCMDRAGASVRARAFKSNYLRFALVNDAVPNPLADLPAKADRAAIDRVIASADAQVLECAKKHGEEGAKEVFYFTIDGPTGKATRVDASYRSRAFKKCAEPLYKKLAFPKVREWNIKVTKHLQM